jgi:hypothetical protein
MTRMERRAVKRWRGLCSGVSRKVSCPLITALISGARRTSTDESEARHVSALSETPAVPMTPMQLF